MVNIFHNDNSAVDNSKLGDFRAAVLEDPALGQKMLVDLFESGEHQLFVDLWIGALSNSSDDKDQTNSVRRIVSTWQHDPAFSDFIKKAFTSILDKNREEKANLEKNS